MPSLTIAYHRVLIAAVGEVDGERLCTQRGKEGDQNGISCGGGGQVQAEKGPIIWERGGETKQ